MDAISFTDGDLIHRAEIVEMLRMAIERHWPLTCVTKKRNKVVTHPLHWVTIKPSSGTVSLSGDYATAIPAGQNATFRCQAGGLSFVFQARKLEVEQQPEDSLSSICEFNIPYKLVCTQLRVSLRVNVDSVHRIPATLYLTNGERLSCQLVDVADSGAKFRLDESLSPQLANSQLIDACSFVLPSAAELHCGIHLVRLKDEPEANSVLLACQFKQLKSQDESILRQFIEETLAIQAINYR